MPNHIGLVPVPADQPLGEFIETLIVKDKELLKKKLEELELTIAQTLDEEQPDSFSYAKLLNYLAKGISTPDLIHLCAAAMWALEDVIDIIKEQ